MGRQYVVSSRLLATVAGRSNSPQTQMRHQLLRLFAQKYLKCRESLDHQEPSKICIGRLVAVDS